MRASRAARLVGLAVWVLGTGCTALREIPRGSYAAVPQRDHVRVGTVDGLVYEFDYATFGADSLVGYRQRDVETRVAEFASMGLPLDQVASMRVRQFDWLRSSLIGGGVLLGIVVGALSRNSSTTGGGDGGGGGVKPPPN
jgi:hypothetical protein